MQRLLLLTLCFFATLTINAQNRTYDGSSNNLVNPTWGASGSQFYRLIPADYGDGASTPGGTDRPNPRIISNEIFDQGSPVADELGLSDYIWVFGQFLDHDITLVENDPTEDISIAIDFQDAHFNPAGNSTVYIPMNRNEGASGTGTDASNPRQHVNHISAWIDASNVYGSDVSRANYLRTGVGGKMKTSTGDLLPWNTTNNELTGSFDANAPFMDDAVGMSASLFVAGDVRANEQPLLTCFHTLFVREHNRLCDQLIIDNPSWSDEQIYQYARKMVGGFLQSITYDEWLPAMGIYLPDYSGYKSNVNGSIYNSFAAAAFRMGHTLLSSEVIRMANDGTIVPEGNMTLQNAFFNPQAVADSGLDCFLKGMATQVEQEFDAKMVDDVRNFLFGGPGSGGLDLAAININRGRERGVADLNTIRSYINLPVYTSFSQINSDPAIYYPLELLYGDINKVDAWVGMLSEEHMNGALIGSTVMEILSRQFYALREGDRFYYENDPVLNQAEKDEIKNTSFHDIIMRNSGITLMQEDVFVAMDHDAIPGCVSTPSAFVDGVIQMETGASVADVEVEIADNSTSIMEMTGGQGTFSFANILTCESYTLTPEKNIDHDNGVSTFDLVLMVQHILGVSQFDSPYKIIASDANGDNSVSTFDLIELRKLILFLETELPNGTPSWRFVDADYVFDNPALPLQEDFPESVTINTMTGSENVNFVAIKVGDVSGNADPLNFAGGIGSDSRNFDGILNFEMEDVDLIADQAYSIPFKYTTISELTGFQFTLNYDENALVFDGFAEGALPNMTAANLGVMEENAAITFSWNGKVAEDNEEALFYINFVAQKNAKLSEMLSISSRYTAAEAYIKKDGDVAFHDVALVFDSEDAVSPTAGNFALYQNQPNPFRQSTLISFNMPQAAAATISIYDVAGRVIKRIEGDFAQGYNEITIKRDDLGANGVLHYEVKSALGSGMRKMILID